MKKRNGFVFIETLIVVAILTFSLLMAYSSFSGMVMKEKTRVDYDDSVYLYRTYYLEKFFRNFNLYKARDYLIEESEYADGYVEKAWVQFGCSADIFLNEEDNISLCENIVEELHVNRLYLTYKNLGFLQACKDDHSIDGVCEVLLQGGESSVINYLLTIGGNSGSIYDAQNEGYRIVVEFMEDSSGNKCTSGDDCKYYYATISLGDIR